MRTMVAFLLLWWTTRMVAAAVPPEFAVDWPLVWRFWLTALALLVWAWGGRGERFLWRLLDEPSETKADGRVAEKRTRLDEILDFYGVEGVTRAHGSYWDGDTLVYILPNRGFLRIPMMWNGEEYVPDEEA